MTSIFFSDQSRVSFEPSLAVAEAAARLQRQGGEVWVFNHFSVLDSTDIRLVCKRLIQPTSRFVAVYLSTLSTQPAERVRTLGLLAEVAAAMPPAGVLVVATDCREVASLMSEVSGVTVKVCPPDRVLEYAVSPEGDALWPKLQATATMARIPLEWGRKDLVLGDSAALVLAKPTCDMQCRTCPRYQACEWSALPTLSALMPETTDIQRELAVNFAQYGFKRYRLVDMLVDESVGHANWLKNLGAACSVPPEYYAKLRFDVVCRHPEIMDALLEAGVVACELTVDSLSAASRRRLGRSMTDVLKGLERLRQQVGPKFLLQVNLQAGLPGESRASVLHDAKLLLSPAGRRVVDMFQVEPFNAKQAAAPGSLGLCGDTASLRAWRPEEAQEVCAEVRELQLQYPGYRVWASIYDFLSTSNLGLKPDAAISLFRNSATMAVSQQDKLTQTVAALRATALAQYLMRFSGV